MRYWLTCCTCRNVEGVWGVGLWPRIRWRFHVNSSSRRVSRRSLKNRAASLRNSRGLPAKAPGPQAPPGACERPAPGQAPPAARIAGIRLYRTHHCPPSKCMSACGHHGRHPRRSTGAVRAQPGAWRAPQSRAEGRAVEHASALAGISASTLASALPQLFTSCRSLRSSIA